MALRGGAGDGTLRRWDFTHGGTMDIEKGLDQFLLPHAMPARDLVLLGEGRQFLASVGFELLERHGRLRSGVDLEASGF